MTEKLVLVTGAAGFCASWLIKELLKNGFKVRATDLKDASVERLEPILDKIEYKPADITKPDTIEPLLNDVDIVFHTAAIFSYSVPMDLLRKVNVEGTKNLIELCLKKEINKMVLWSSVAVYGEASPKFYEIPIKECPIEKMNPVVRGKYDLSKREQEGN